jgi:hypothetical protein
MYGGNWKPISRVLGNGNGSMTGNIGPRIGRKFTP